MTITQKLTRTANSILNHRDRGNLVSGTRSQELIVRYDDLKADAISEGTWDKYCETNNLVKSHNSGDCWA